jgi:hypothetical protein
VTNWNAGGYLGQSHSSHGGHIGMWVLWPDLIFLSHSNVLSPGFKRCWWLDVVVPVCNSSTCKVGLKIQGQPGIHSETLSQKKKLNSKVNKQKLTPGP